MLENCTSEMRALQAQLNFRRKVFEQNPNSEDMKSVYKFSKKAENEKTETLTVEELTENVTKLVRHTFNIEPRPRDRDEPTQALLVGKTVRHTFNEDGEEKCWQGRVISIVLASQLRKTISMYCKTNILY